MITVSRISYVLVLFGSVIHAPDTVRSVAPFPVTGRTWPAPAPPIIVTVKPANWPGVHERVVSYSFVNSPAATISYWLVPSGCVPHALLTVRRVAVFAVIVLRLARARALP